jgi:hypothetical protein
MSSEVDARLLKVGAMFLAMVLALGLLFWWGLRRPPGSRRWLRWLGMGCGTLAALPVLLTLLLTADALVTRAWTIPPGSWTGTVVDAASGAPVPGAAVYMKWTTEHDLNPLEAIRGILAGHHHPRDRTFIGDAMTYTDARGRYALPDREFSRTVNWRSKLYELNVWIYRKGYIGYSNNHPFREVARELPYNAYPREEAVVKLEPWREGLSRARHFEFLNTTTYGMSPSYSLEFDALYQWEYDEAYGK